MILVVAVAAASAAALVWPARQPLPQRAHPFSPFGRVPGSPTPAQGAVRTLTPLAPLLAVPVVLFGPGSSLLLGSIVAGAAWGVVLLRAKGRQRKDADRVRTRLVEAADALASELRAGLPPAAALSHVARTWEEFVPIATAARIDADVAGSFRHAGARPGAEALAEVGAAWQIAQQSGSGLASALDRVVARAREDLEVHRVISGELASARATARMLALLPAGVLWLNGSKGPWHFLFATTPGLTCLALGLVLAFAGMWWIERIVDNVSKGYA